MMLMNLAEAKLAKMRSGKEGNKPRASVHQDELPYDVIDPYELAYEVVSERERTFFADLDGEIQFLKDNFKNSGHVVTPDDEAKFRRFLTDNPHVDAMNLWELYGAVIHPPLTFASMKDQEAHPPGLLTKVKTPGQFLRYMPQLATLLDWDTGKRSRSESIDRPSYEWNYAYLGEAPQSSIVFLDDGTTPIEYVDE